MLRKITAVNEKNLIITFCMNLLRLASLLPGYKIFISLGYVFFLAGIRRYTSFTNLFASYKIKTIYILYFCYNYKTRLFHDTVNCNFIADMYIIYVLCIIHTRNNQ